MDIYENISDVLNDAIHQSLINNILNMYNRNTITSNHTIRTIHSRTNFENTFVNTEHVYHLDNDDLSSSILLDVITQFGSPGSDSGWIEKIKTKRKQQLKQISYKKIKENDPVLEETCSICLENFQVGEYKRKLKCCHTFHKKCIDHWFKSDHSDCPMCRADTFN